MNVPVSVGGEDVAIRTSGRHRVSAKFGLGTRMDDSPVGVHTDSQEEAVLTRHR